MLNEARGLSSAHRLEVEADITGCSRGGERL